MKVKSIILRGVSLFIMRACWQNYVKGLLDTAHTSPKGFQELKFLYKFLIEE
jgi:hypothetical protein